MTLQLSEQDFHIIRALRECHVLQDVKTHRIEAPQGFMALVCSDCDQLHDKIEFLRTVSKEASRLERVHLFALNGGGTLLSPNSETRTGDEHTIITNHIQGAIELKGLDTLVTKCHAPCGAAYAKGLDFHQVLRRTFEGKFYAKSVVDGLRHVVCFVQIDYGRFRDPENRKKTYAITMRDWTNFIARQGIRFD